MRVVTNSDIEELKVWRQKQIDTAEELSKFKFKNAFDSPLSVFLADVNKNFAALETEAAENSKLENLILIEVKALLAASLAKFQFSPEVTQLQPLQHLPTVLKSREVLIPTPGRSGDGEDFALPAKVDYNNPI